MRSLTKHHFMKSVLEHFSEGVSLQIGGDIAIRRIERYLPQVSAMIFYNKDTRLAFALASPSGGGSGD